MPRNSSIQARIARANLKNQQLLGDKIQIQRSKIRFVPDRMGWKNLNQVDSFSKPTPIGM